MPRNSADFYFTSFPSNLFHFASLYVLSVALFYFISVVESFIFLRKVAVFSSIIRWGWLKTNKHRARYVGVRTPRLSSLQIDSVYRASDLLFDRRDANEIGLSSLKHRLDCVFSRFLRSIGDLLNCVRTPE